MANLVETIFRHLPRPFRRLGLKLTLTYTLITVAGILLLQAVSGILVRSFMAHQMSLERQTITVWLKDSASKAAPLLEAASPDVRKIQSWLRDSLRQSERDGQGASQSQSDRRFSPPGIRAVIIDRGGAVKAAFGGGDNPLDPLLLPVEASGIVEETLAGRHDSPNFSAWGTKGLLGAAVPIFGSQGTVVGAIIVTIPQSRAPEGILAQFLSWRNALLILLVAGIVGAIFGLLSARWLTQRLRRFSAATAGWGRGDFSVMIDDQADDEISHLAKDFNGMAAELRLLLSDRERLAVMEERNRFARDLHDSVTQAVYGIALYGKAASSQLAAGRTEQAGEDLRMLLDAAQQALREMRLLIFELRPMELQEQGLASVIRSRLEAVEERVGIKAKLEVEGENNLPPEVEEGLYRIAQEALNNVLKHAQSTEVRICLQRDQSRVILEIADNGVGFDREAEAGGGLGLKGMKERAARLGGTLSVTSEPGQGSRVRVEVDL